MSYALWYFLSPANWTTLATIMALLAHVRHKRQAASLWLALGCGWFVFITVMPVGIWAIEPLELRYPVIQSPARVDGIIMLTGGEKLSISERSGQPEFGDISERVTASLGLLMDHPEAQLYVVGGVTNPAGVRDIDVVKQLANQLHAPAARIHYISHTFTTWDNAKATAPLIKSGEQWLLVTSAFHMPRSMLCFDALGVRPTPYPVDHRLWPYHNLWGMFSLNAPANIERLDYALHEWLGIITYRIQGYTRKLWP